MKVSIICRVRWEIPFEFFSLRNYSEPFVYNFIFWFSRQAWWWTGWEGGWGRWPFPFFLPRPWLLSSLFVGAFYCLWPWWRRIYFLLPCLVLFILLSCWGNLLVFWYPLCWLIIWVISTLLFFCLASSLELTTGEITFASCWYLCRDSASFKLFGII